MGGEQNDKTKSTKQNSKASKEIYNIPSLHVFNSFCRLPNLCCSMVRGTKKGVACIAQR